MFLQRFTSDFLCRASEESFMTIVYDALGGRRAGCLLGEPTRRRPGLPGPTPPRRPTVRRPAPTRPWYVRVLEPTSLHRNSFARSSEESSRTVVCDSLEGKSRVFPWQTDPPAFQHAPPHPTPLRLAPPVVCPGFGRDKYNISYFDLEFPDMPCMKKVYEDK